MKFEYIRRRWIDFRTGHAEILVMVMWGWTTVLISYRMFIELIIDIPLWVMVIVFPSIYIPIGSALGWFYRRKLLATQMSLMFSEYPEMKKMQGDVAQLKEDVAWIKDHLGK